MNLFLNYLIFIGTIGLAVYYITVFVINIVRSKHVKKELINNCKSLEGVVNKILVHKKKTYVRVKFESPRNRQTFQMLFEYFTDDWNNRAAVGDPINLIFPDVTKLKKVYSFPVFLEGDTIKMSKGPFFTDLLIVAYGIWVVISTTIGMVTKHGFTTNVSPLEVTPGIMLILFIVMTLILFPASLDRLNNAPTEENNRYLQIYGYAAVAEVKTFSLHGSKNAKGFKESFMEIEYITPTGEKINANCQSYYYTETQEQYVNILYDEHNYKNVVYFVLPEKEKHKKNKHKQKTEEKSVEEQIEEIKE